MINIVCINHGEEYGDEYTNNLYSMTVRHLHQPFAFTCFTDRPRPLHPAIQQHNIAHWGLSGWFNKLRLFDGNEMPFDSFLYLDITLIIKDSLDPLIDCVRNKPFVVQKDWSYDCFNSSVMWITRDPVNQSVWESFAGGRKYRTRHDGDQDYINAVFREQKLLDTVAYFPNGWIQSYKRLREVSAKSMVSARQELAKAIILKFHGHPKPHELLLPKREFRRLQFWNPLMLCKDWSFLNDEIREWWR